MGRWKRACHVALLMVLLVAPSPGRALDLGEGPVLLVADRVEYDTKENIVSAHGNVEVVRGERRLLADMLRYDRDADQMEAEGNVILVEPSGETLFAERITLSGDLKEGVARQLRALMPDESRLAAEGGRRTGGNRTEMDRAVYSPCPLCPESTSAPLWQLSARRVIHDQVAHDVIYHHAFLEIAGVPVFYLPYFRHPDPTVERRSGFLPPSFGNDSILGLSVETPYYFALARNYDLTVTPIFYSQEKPVLIGQYRHLLESGSFEFSGSGTYTSRPIKEQGEEEPSGDTFRGAIDGDGRFRLKDDWRWGFDLEAASDDTYLQRYGFSSKNVLTSRLLAERYWERNSLTFNAYGFQGLREQDSQGLIPVALPQARLSLTSDPWHWNSRFSLDTETLALTRYDGLDTRRLSADGGWELPWQSPIGDRYRLRLSLRGDFYQTDGDPETFENNGTGTKARAVPRATLDWSWPFIGDVFGLSQVIEPVAMATVATTGNNNEQIPNEDSQDFEFDDASLFEPNRFPGLDRVQGGPSLAYGMRFSSFTDRQLIDGLFGQAYTFEKDPRFEPNTGLDSRLSDFVGRVDFTPGDWVDVRYRFGLDHEQLEFTRNEIGVGFGPAPVRFDAGYLMLKDDPALQSQKKREEITAGLSFRASDALSFRLQGRRDLEAERNIFFKFGMIYTHPCLQIAAGVERRNTNNRDAEDTTTFSFRVSFLNLGEIGADSGSLVGGQ